LIERLPNRLKHAGMKVLFQTLILVLLVGCTEKTKEKVVAPVNQGYVLKHGQGTVFPGSDSSVIIKASPELGSQQDISIVQKIGPGKGTGLHYHNDADEIFYVMEGAGTAVLGDKSYGIEAGDVIFIPKNLDHKIRKYDSTGILKVLFFMDKPGLLEFFKERHKQFYVDKKPLTLRELNRIAEKYNTHFKTLN
jgi:mannose-6-phosphate isomerase-like protein (cupin superfamily)